MKKKTMTGYIGIDIGKKKCVTCLMEQDGTILEQSSYPNTLLDAYRFAKHALEKYDQCKAVVESTANMWLKTFEAFESNGIEISSRIQSKLER
ncbi:MAG: transposase [Nitrososphaerota archaeon]|jgi:activator of 2-hydroxyglutaryl-CoA dehydratase|nr:transposase [Nitrososphaerota archaeon]MDG6922991.1 transposase [Nitrososphaerota archaeon]